MLQNENEVYNGILERYVPMMGLNPKENLEVVSVCCGKCHEASVLSEYFSSKVKGIDIDSEEIRYARLNYPMVEFIQGDASNLGEHFSEVDLCIFRHPNPFEDGFSSILKSAYEVMKPEGSFLITTYSQPDAIHMLYHMDGLGVENIAFDDNPDNDFSGRIGPVELGTDKKIIAARKKRLSKLERITRNLARLFI